MTESPKILIAEDDAGFGDLLVELLKLHAFAATRVERGDRVLACLQAQEPDLLILDLMLPGLDGLSVCRQARQQGFDRPILILTARGAETDELKGFELGADDYLTKPVSPPRLLARVKALLRRAGEANLMTPPIRVGQLVVYPSRRTIEWHGQPLELSGGEFDLLRLLAAEAGSVVSRDRVYQELRGQAFDGIDRSMDLRISRIRKQLGDDPRAPRLIHTIHGVGYMLAIER